MGEREDGKEAGCLGDTFIKGYLPTHIIGHRVSLDELASPLLASFIGICLIAVVSVSRGFL